MTFKRLLHALVVLFIMGGTAACEGIHQSSSPATQSSQPSSLVSCNGESCNGLDPKGRCDIDSTNPLSSDWVNSAAGVVEVQLKYSPNCQAAWGKIVYAKPGDKVTVSSSSMKGKPQTNTVNWGTDQHTLMTFAKSGDKVTVCGTSTNGVPDEVKSGEQKCITVTVPEHQ